MGSDDVQSLKHFTLANISTNKIIVLIPSIFSVLYISIQLDLFLIFPIITV